MSYKANRKALELPEQTAKATSIHTMFFIGKQWKLNANKKENQEIIHRIIVNCVKNN
jgi:hypothetical protein